MDTKELNIYAPGLKTNEINPEILNLMMKFMDIYHAVSKDERKMFETPELIWNGTSNSALAAYFSNIDKHLLFNLMNECARTKFKILLQTACSYIAYITKDMDIENMRKTLNIKGDFTTMEEEKIKLENKWTDTPSKKQTKMSAPATPVVSTQIQPTPPVSVAPVAHVAPVAPVSPPAPKTKPKSKSSKK
jgi:hypothetical protein